MIDQPFEKIIVCPRCAGNGTVPLVPSELTRPFSRIRLNRDSVLYLRDLLLEDRDQFFEEKRALDARGIPSLDVLNEIRSLEKVLRSVEFVISEERWDALEEGVVSNGVRSS